MKRLQVEKELVEKEELTAIKNSLPLSDTNTHLYQDELKASEVNVDENNVNLKTHEIVKTETGEIEKKPRLRSKDDLNSQKCRFSPFAYHRFTRSHKEKTKDGTVHMVLRCRYCFDMVSVRITFILKEGQYIAIKETIPVEESKG